MARRRGGLFVGAAEAMDILGIGAGVFRRWVRNGVVPRYTDPDTETAYYSRPQLERLAAELRTETVNPPDRLRPTEVES